MSFCGFLIRVYACKRADDERGEKISGRLKLNRQLNHLAKAARSGN